jgi:hypothetical protein
LKPYRRKAGSEVVAVRLDLDTDGFTYRKWGGTQTCKRGDWLVQSDGDVYTVDADTFAETYRQVRPGLYEKAAPVWGRLAEEPGQIRTKEGTTDYDAGDFLIYNDPEGRDGYAMAAERFKSLYEPVDDAA